MGSTTCLQSETGFNDEDRREVPERRHDDNGLSAQTLDTSFDIALRSY